jgi:ABC-2 type transport system ATP-binding protein
MTEFAIDVSQLHRRFGSTLALDDVTLRVRPGMVFGLVGQNGAGKTTLIKHLLGMLRPHKGRVSVFGLAPAEHPVQVLGRIGYLSEDRDLPRWMRVGELLRYQMAFYPKWDANYADQLRREFDLDSGQKVRHLSRGQTALLGLLVALAHRPELLILDEPSSGLDPLARGDILSAIIRTVADEGRTVLFSSHLLEEVQRVADEVALLYQGRVLLEGELDQLLQQHHRLVLQFADAVEPPLSLPGAMNLQGGGRDWTCVCNGQLDELKQAVELWRGEIVEQRCPSLEELFVARVRSQTKHAGPAIPTAED